MNLALLTRLRFIDCMLSQYGSINRNLLCDYFALSVPQVSIDIRTYLAKCPGNMVYDRTLKSYVRSATYVRQYL